MNSVPHTILHIGLGSFHRAHQAAYLHRLHELGDRSWSIVGGNIRNDLADTMTALAAQHGEYTLETVAPSGERRYERIRSIREVIPCDPSLARLIEVGADASTRIIAFTVTEAGYCLDANNALDVHCPDLRADLEGGSLGTIYAAITAILRERVRRGGAPVTLLSCDNLRSNGARFRAGLLDFLARRGEAALRGWVEVYTTCPCDMVDRITPRPSPEVAERVRAATGWDDRAPVMGESFIQWVIEDDFIAGRPAWERVGAELVQTVHAHEEAKIRILNATHGCVAWAGALDDLSYIHEGMAVPAIRQMALEYTDDVMPCLDTPDHPSPIDLAKYRDVVFERFGNPHVRDTNSRVAADGYTKISGFVLPTIRERLEKGQSIAAVARLPVLLLAVLERWHTGSLPFAYRDQVMDPARGHAVCAAAEPLRAFVGERSLWAEWTDNETLYRALKAAQVQVRARLGLGGAC
jgi:D-arabinitol 4-dehydrogenase